MKHVTNKAVREDTNRIVLWRILRISIIPGYIPALMYAVPFIIASILFAVLGIWPAFILMLIFAALCFALLRYLLPEVRNAHRNFSLFFKLFDASIAKRLNGNHSLDRNGELSIASEAFFLHADHDCLAYIAAEEIDFSKPILHERHQYTMDFTHRAWNREWLSEELFHFPQPNGEYKTLCLNRMSTLFQWVNEHNGFIRPMQSSQSE
ncbi:MAG: hypothetical protein IJU28_07330 [Clostridia bacterium]|nr:hypothetical protein [Clostridia bacterium]